MYRIVGNMASLFKSALVAVGLGCVLWAGTAGRVKATGDSSELSGQKAAMKPDQVNTAAWDKAWVNLVNDAEQTFRPSVSKLLGVEVELVVGNEGKKEDELTLTVLDAAGQKLAVVTENVPTADCDHVMFEIPEGGVDVTPGQSYSVKLSGGTTFGWKYVVGGYKSGDATFNGKPLLPDTRSTFLFRTFGPK
jgi:hypothetical protein